MPGARIEVNWTWSSIYPSGAVSVPKNTNPKKEIWSGFQAVCSNPWDKNKQLDATLRRKLRQYVAPGLASDQVSDKKSGRLIANLGSTFFPLNAIVFTPGSVRGNHSPRFRKSIDKKHRISYGEP
jgi:hypothetical protein